VVVEKNVSVPQHFLTTTMKRAYFFKGKGPLPVRKNSTQSTPDFKNPLSDSIK
jgi:hypothetical protein